MFEPENDLERALLQAFAQPVKRPPFLRLLLESEVLVVFIPEGSQVVDGKGVIRSGEVLDRGVGSILLDRGGPVTSKMRTGIPIVTKKRRFFNLFRS